MSVFPKFPETGLAIIWIYLLLDVSVNFTPSQPGFQPNKAVSLPLSNCTTPLPIALESCSNYVKTRQVFESARKKTFLFGVLEFFVSGVISGGLLGPLHLTLSPNY